MTATTTRRTLCRQCRRTVTAAVEGRCTDRRECGMFLIRTNAAKPVTPIYPTYADLPFTY